ncbi:MAG: hypothetical protein E7467_02745 [Ruminococcaceae bacterium]|nr:hypothetical protein [Oscillospiraceae bacterium]
MRYVRSIAVCVTVFVLLGGFLFWNNFVIQTEETKITLESLPEAFNDLRIVLLTDLHGREFERDNSYLLQQVRAAAPELICVSGDLFDLQTEMGDIYLLLSQLTIIAPTYYVTGNHEWQVDDLPSVLQRMEQCGVTVLRNEYVILRRGDERLILAGVDDPCGPKDQKSPEELVRQIRAAEGEDACIVMLCHRNDGLETWAQLGVDLVLSGHCHGGVVRLPYVGGVFGTKRELFPAFSAGLYRENSTQLYVSRGLGYTNVRLRLFNRPHLPVLRLVNNS